jgi:hypothetical protein
MTAVACQVVPNTPLRKWRKRHNQTWYWLEEQTGLPLRTLHRVARGHACSGRVAIAIHEVTGLPVKTLLRGHRQ